MVTPLKARPEIIAARTNIQVAGTPKVVEIYNELRVVTPGEDGIPLPKTAPVVGTVVAVRHPPTVPALPLQFEDAADYDIQFLDVDQGMLDSYIFCLLEDKRGDLWLAPILG